MKQLKILFINAKKVITALSLLLVSATLFAQSDSVYRIALILPFQAQSTSEKLEIIANAHDLYTAQKIRLDGDALIGMDFYQGVLQSLRELNDSIKVELSVYDNWNKDSVTTELLKKDELKKQHVIIGSVSTSTGKLVAEFCKANKILNIQPFSPSKSLTCNNAYHLKLAPTIDSHTDALFTSIVDSFAGANVIIYTPNAEISLSAATRFDSLFKDYNKTATLKFTTALLNTSNMLLNGKKTTAIEQLKVNKTNVFIITSFEESFVNGNMRVLHDLREKYNLQVYGMPTWLNGDILRLDYINDFNTRISDAYYVDSTRIETQTFINNYATNFNTDASKYSFLGYDVMNFTLHNLSNYGSHFLAQISTQRFKGTAYTFDISKVLNKPISTSIATNADLLINYYENKFTNVYKVQDYQLKKVW